MEFLKAAADLWADDFQEQPATQTRWEMIPQVNTQKKHIPHRLQYDNKRL